MEKYITDETLAKYRELLPYGSIKEIANKVGVTPVAVGQFLKGKSKNFLIEREILKVIIEVQTERNKLLKQAGIL